MRWVRAGALAALAMSSSAAPAETLHVTYALSLIGLPIGGATVKAELTATSYVVEGQAKLNALASLVNNSRGATRGRGAIVEGHISPVNFATTAVAGASTRTIRMALKDNAVAGIEIEPPFDEKPDRVPLRAQDKQHVVDPVGAFVFPAPKTGAALSPAACERTLPVFDGYTRFDLKLSYAGRKKVEAKGYSGEAVVCAVRYEPIAGHRTERPATKFMAENKDLQIWLAPVAGAPVLIPFHVSVRTMVGTLEIEATEFAVSP